MFVFYSFLEWFMAIQNVLLITFFIWGDPAPIWKSVID